MTAVCAAYCIPLLNVCLRENTACPLQPPGVHGAGQMKTWKHIFNLPSHVRMLLMFRNVVVKYAHRVHTLYIGLASCCDCSVLCITLSKTGPMQTKFLLTQYNIWVFLAHCRFCFYLNTAYSILGDSMHTLDCCHWCFVVIHFPFGMSALSQCGAVGIVVWPWRRKSPKITGCSSIFCVGQHVTVTAGGLILARETTQSNPVIALGTHLQVQRIKCNAAQDNGLLSFCVI